MTKITVFQEFENFEMTDLGIPTTRSLSIVGSSQKIPRDPIEDGNIIMEKIAVVSRTAGSFIRFGNFEIFHFRNEFEMVRKLADHVISHHFNFTGVNR